MSVNKLKLGDLETTVDFIPMTDKKRYWFKFGTIGGLFLDRNQAHLLKLWLEEHLK